MDSHFLNILFSLKVFPKNIWANIKAVLTSFKAF